MKSLRRWNLLITLTMIPSGIALMSRPASAAIVSCTSDACRDDCDYQCDGICAKECKLELCYDNNSNVHNFRGQCSSFT